MTGARAARPGVTDQQKIIAGAAFAVIAAGVLYFELADPGPRAAAPVASTAAGLASPAVAAGIKPSGAAKTAGTTAAGLDPTLHPRAMLVTEAVVYGGTGRNIFAAPGAAAPVAVALPKPIAPARPPVTPAPYTPPVGPPPPPPIELKFFGIATRADGHRQAFLLHGEDVFLATGGEIVLRKYKVIEVGARSIQIEDLTNNNRQTLPLLATP